MSWIEVFPHLPVWLNTHFSILFHSLPDCQALESVQKLALKFVKGLHHAHMRQPSSGCGSFPLSLEDLISMYKIMHGLLDFPCDAVFAAPPAGLRGHTLKIHQQRCKTRRCQYVFSVRVVPYWNKLPEEIMNASSVETFKLRLHARLQSLFPEVPF